MRTSSPTRSRAKYDLTPDINIYASYGTGYKGPMISNPSGQPQLLVRPELSKSYEIGLKRRCSTAGCLQHRRLQGRLYNFQGQQRVCPPAISYYTTTNAGRLQTRASRPT
ncbi:MAG: TonB-dependent receptor [Gemmatales bacterium]